jgi:hypothetical protein
VNIFAGKRFDRAGAGDQDLALNGSREQVVVLREFRPLAEVIA